MWSLTIYVACLTLVLVEAQYCPLCDITTCENETVLEESCPSGIVLEPCGCCKICASGFGESCGGAFGVNGTCEYTLICTVDEKQYLNGVNVIGICTSELFFYGALQESAKKHLRVIIKKSPDLHYIACIVNMLYNFVSCALLFYFLTKYVGFFD